MVKLVQRSSFKFNPIAAAIALVLATPFASNVALAGSGFGDGIDANNAQVKVPTYYANSPVGPVTALAPVTGAQNVIALTGLAATANTGKALRKFVDTLPGIPGLTPATVGGLAFGTNNLGQYIPLAIPEKWVDLNGVLTTDDYYEIAVVEYTEHMHSDLVDYNADGSVKMAGQNPVLHGTRLRGYVQLSTAKNPGKHIQLFYPAVGAAAALPILDAAGAPVYAYDNPHHLGPVVKSAKGTAVRVKFTNYLPTGSGGDLFLPVDSTITGAGLGPDGQTKYTQNRAEIHLVGGQAPWISAGSPHQWVAPAGETNPAVDANGLAIVGGVINARGSSAQNVPDMADPGAGSATLYFPNDMSARFMFYQDRTSGLTRLNSYAGLEAGYLVTDDTEKNLILSGAIPADQIPLIIEDKTFVPNNVAQQDALWDTAHWGQPGDLWFPHVYEKNQDPASITGTNPVGRWDFGPLFWPIFPATDPLPTGAYGDASFTPEAYLDTPLINGTAYPTLTVDPKAYRFRILNASNDRYINLGFYKADGTISAIQLDLNGNPVVNSAGVPQVFANTEVKMVPAVGDAAGNPVGWGKNTITGLPVVDASGQPAQWPLPQYPSLKTNINSEPSGPSRAWPVDGRPGGAPDPAAAGPDFIVFGNDGGLLPNPVDIPSQPITYESNRRSITIGNIYGYGMLLGPAERADTIVDFSQYAGQTLILFNDAPAPTPFNDVRNDYYTGGPDQTGSGGAYSTKPGYGPNTRTMMQIKVNAAGAVAPVAFDPTPLVTALPIAYGASQTAPIVPAVAYNAAFSTNDTDIFGHVATGSIAQPTLDFSTSVGGGVTLSDFKLITSGGTAIAGGQIVGNAIPGSGTGYDPLNPPILVVNNVVNGVACLPLDALGVPIAPAVSASATAVVDPGTPAVGGAPAVPSTKQVTQIINFNPGSGYTCAPTVTFTNPPGTNGVGAQVSVVSAPANFHSLAVFTKAEQELFDNRGRYNSTGGVELPLVNGVIQTTVPLNYFDSATEIIKDGEVQVWKLVDNGFWSNSIHFDMVDVQLINRVGWDGTVKAPATNEVGWKDTLRLNPLEDVLVAMRAKRSTVPFGLPQSKRLLDPSKPVDTVNPPVPPALPVPGVLYASGLGFTAAAGVNPALNASNVQAVFDNEFAWNSAILGHSENDFTRPVVFQPTVLKPDAPTNLTDPLGNGTLTWTDPTPAGQLAAPLAVPPLVATLANPKNEIGFKILQANLDVNGQPLLPYTPVLVAGVPATVPANVTHWTMPLPMVANVGYAVVAYNVAGDSDLSTPFAEAVPIAPTTFNAGPVLYNSVTLSWSGQSTSNKLQVWRSVNGAAATQIATLAGTASGYVDNAANAALNAYTPVVSAVTNYTYQIVATNALGTVSSALLPVTTPMMPMTAPAVVTAVSNNQGTAITVKWTDSANNEAAYQVNVSVDGGAYAPVPGTVPTMTRTLAQGTATAPVANVPNLTLAPNFVSAPGHTYQFGVSALNAPSASATTLSPLVDLTIPVPAAPATLTPGVQTPTRAPFTWSPVTVPVTVPAATISYVVQTNTNGLGWVSSTPTNATSANPPIVAGNSYQFQVVARATRFGVIQPSLTPSAPLNVVTPPAASTGLLAAPPLGAAVGSGLVTVSWNNASSNVTSWTVQRRPNFGPAASRVYSAITPVVSGTAPAYTFTDTGLISNSSYTYRVTAVNANGTNGPATSNNVTAP